MKAERVRSLVTRGSQAVGVARSNGAIGPIGVPRSASAASSEASASVGSASADKTSASGELIATRGEVSLSLVVCRRASRMRVIDFRAGSQPDKLDLVLHTAEKHGIRRVFTVVEREEVPTWTRLGFQKEGTIPGFYKRSDGHILGLAVDDGCESTTRLRVKDGEEDERSERVYQAAKKRQKARTAEQLPSVKLQVARPQDVERAISVAREAGRDLTDFSPFGRDPELSHYLMTARGGFSVLVGVEAQTCFDSAELDLLTAPRGEKEMWMTASGVSDLLEILTKQGICSVFAVTPLSSVDLATVMLAAGFRRTGLLDKHLFVEGRSQDGMLWSKKLLEPT